MNKIKNFFKKNKDSQLEEEKKQLKPPAAP